VATDGESIPLLITVAGEDREARILGEAGIALREIAEDEDGAALGLDATGMQTIGTEAGTVEVTRLLLNIGHEMKDSAVLAL